jgi:DNA primase
VVALLGVKISSQQLELLKHIPKIVLMLDGDEIGTEASKKIASLLRTHRTSIITLPQHHDPASIPEQMIRDLLNPFFSFQQREFSGRTKIMNLCIDFKTRAP